MHPGPCLTQTVLLLLRRHAGGCVELGLVTVHSAPSRVVTVTPPNSKRVTRPTRRSAAAAATPPARATQAWLRACEAAARASSAARRARWNASSAICAYVTAPSAARSALRRAAAARVLRFLLRLRLRLRLPWGGRRARASCVAARGRCGRSGKMHAMPRSVRQHVSVWPAKGSKVVQTVQIRHESSVSPPKRRANQSSSSLAMLADVRGARTALEPEEAADGARCCDAGGGDHQNTHSTRTRRAGGDGAQPARRWRVADGAHRRRRHAAQPAPDSVHTRARPWSPPHKKLCTWKTSAGSPGSLCASTMRAFCLRSPRRPRLQRLTQCFIARTEHTSSTPKPVIVKQPGAVRTITYGSVEPRIDAHMPFARHQESRRPRLDWRNISTPTSCQRGQIWKPKQSHAASSPRLHALRPWPKTSHDLPAASIDQQRGAGGWNGLGGPHEWWGKHHGVERTQGPSHVRFPLVPHGLAVVEQRCVQESSQMKLRMERDYATRWS